MTPSRSRAFVAVGILVGAMASGGGLLARGFASKPPQGNTERLLDDVLARIQRSYVDSISTAELLNRTVAGFLEELGDPNTVYLEPARLKRLAENTTGLYTGLGVRFDAREGWPRVIAPLPGSPAERAGLLAGDRIVEIDGRSTRGWTDDETRNAMRGPSGTAVTLLVERPGRSGQLPVKLVREEVHRTAVRRTALLPDGVGYVDLRAFSDSTERELARAVDSLKQAGMTSLVLDLRGNPGGLLAQGVAVSELFLDPKQTIVSMRGRAATTPQVFADSAPQAWPTLPMVVLADRGTASAGEIVTGALQDHDRALVMGQPTYGKGSAQAVFQTAAGGGLKLTTARWYTPSGRSIDRMVESGAGGRDDDAPRFRTDAGRTVFGGGGISPDVLVSERAALTAELALQSALGVRVTDFRDALTAYATSLRGTGRVTSWDTPVTDDMLEGAWRMVQARGFALDRTMWNGARSLVASFVGREMVRVQLGAVAEARRTIEGDELIQRAATVLRSARSPRDVLSAADSTAP